MSQLANDNCAMKAIVSMVIMLKKVTFVHYIIVNVVGSSAGHIKMFLRKNTSKRAIGA
jgi:hypothetical protein